MHNFLEFGPILDNLRFPIDLGLFTMKGRCHRVLYLDAAVFPDGLSMCKNRNEVSLHLDLSCGQREHSLRTVITAVEGFYEYHSSNPDS